MGKAILSPDHPLEITHMHASSVYRYYYYFAALHPSSFSAMESYPTKILFAFVKTRIYCLSTFISCSHIRSARTHRKRKSQFSKRTKDKFTVRSSDICCLANKPLFKYTYTRAFSSKLKQGTWQGTK